MTDSIKNRIRKHVKNIRARNNRCHHTCIDLAKRIGKDSDDWYLVEGKVNGNTHYWVKAGNEIIDPHYYIIGERSMLFAKGEYWDDTSDYKAKKKIKMKNVKPNLKLCDCDVTHSRDAKKIGSKDSFVKQWHFDIDSELNWIKV